jgi:hypothetical protein
MSIIGPTSALGSNKIIRFPNDDGTISLLKYVLLGSRSASSGGGTLTVANMTTYSSLLFQFIFFDGASSRHISTLLVDRSVFTVSAQRMVSLQTPGQAATVRVTYASTTSVSINFTNAGSSTGTIITVFGVV